MQILYVDDDSDDREMFADAVREVDAQISVQEFASGHEIIDFLRGSPAVPQFIFIDINMPMMDGHECAARIRQTEKLVAAKIVMYSTAFSPTDLKKFEDLNYHHLVKPAEFSTLVNSIKQLMQK